MVYDRDGILLARGLDVETIEGWESVSRRHQWGLAPSQAHTVPDLGPKVPTRYSSQRSTYLWFVARACECIYLVCHERTGLQGFFMCHTRNPHMGASDRSRPNGMALLCSWKE